MVFFPEFLVEYKCCGRYEANLRRDFQAQFKPVASFWGRLPFSWQFHPSEIKDKLCAIISLWLCTYFPFILCSKVLGPFWVSSFLRFAFRLLFGFGCNFFFVVPSSSCTNRAAKQTFVLSLKLAAHRKRHTNTHTKTHRHQLALIKRRGENTASSDRRVQSA